MSFEAERGEVLDAVGRIVAAGLVAGASGNVSRRIRTPDGDVFAITASRVPYHRFELDDVLVVDADVEPILGDGIPSSESLLHLAVYAARRDVGAVTVGRELDEAIAAAELVERVAQIYVISGALGGATELPAQIVEQERRAYRMLHELD